MSGLICGKSGRKGLQDGSESCCDGGCGDVSPDKKTGSRAEDAKDRMKR